MMFPKYFAILGGTASALYVAWSYARVDRRRPSEPPESLYTAVLVKRNSGELLLARKAAGTAGEGHLDLYTSRVERGESALDAACRSLSEGCGLETTPDALRLSAEILTDYDSKKWGRTLVYACELASCEGTPKTSDD